MNRRTFLSRLGLATAGAVATLTIDPEQLLWTPGKKTIIDLGATKAIVPATDAEMVSAFTRVLLSNAGAQASDVDGARRQMTSFIGGMKLEIFGGGHEATFHYDKHDNLVGKYSEADLKLLNAPLYPRGRYD